MFVAGSAVGLAVGFVVADFVVVDSAAGFVVVVDSAVVVVFFGIAVMIVFAYVVASARGYILHHHRSD